MATRHTICWRPRQSVKRFVTPADDSIPKAVCITIDLGGLHIPEGMTVQLTDNKITVNGVGKSGPVQTTVHFKAYPRGSGGDNDPPDFALSATYTSADTLGLFEGRSVGGRYVSRAAAEMGRLQSIEYQARTRTEHPQCRPGMMDAVDCLGPLAEWCAANPNRTTSGLGFFKPSATPAGATARFQSKVRYGSTAAHGPRGGRSFLASPL